MEEVERTVAGAKQGKCVPSYPLYRMRVATPSQKVTIFWRDGRDTDIYAKRDQKGPKEPSPT
jgi:hypothetical protein